MRTTKEPASFATAIPTEQQQTSHHHFLNLSLLSTSLSPHLSLIEEVKRPQTSTLDGSDSDDDITAPKPPTADAKKTKNPSPPSALDDSFDFDNYKSSMSPRRSATKNKTLLAAQKVRSLLFVCSNDEAPNLVTVSDAPGP